MIIYGCDTPRRVGGYGDRIVGIISCKVLADCLGREFRIAWTKEDITYFVNYSRYDDKEPAPALFAIDNQQMLKSHLMTADPVFPAPRIKLYTNQEIAQYLFKNPRFTGDYFASMFAAYRSLYTDILLPTEFSAEVIARTIRTAKPVLVGIQIRTGDCYMKTNPGETHQRVANPATDIKDFMTKIKAHIEETYAEYSVFVSSDYEHVLGVAQTVWSPEAICYLDQVPQHIDRAVAGDFSKVYIDNYILSQKTTRLYISDYSNYGRVAALSSGQETIYSLQTEILDRRRLLTNMESVFI